MLNILEIIKKPIVSEKTSKLAQADCYTFYVGSKANKSEIAKAIKKMYKVDPQSVRILKTMGKKKRRGRFFGFESGFKKAIIKIKKGQKISDFEIKE
jgi:large subunit ribosomal protein L23